MNHFLSWETLLGICIYGALGWLFSAVIIQSYKTFMFSRPLSAAEKSASKSADIKSANLGAAIFAIAWLMLNSNFH